MELDPRSLHAELRARRAEIQALLNGDGQIDTRRLLRLLASLDYHQWLLFCEIAPEPNGPRTLLRQLLRQPPGRATFLVLAGLFGWALAKGYISFGQLFRWLIGSGP